MAVYQKCSNFAAVMTKQTCIHERNIALQKIYERILKSQVNRNLLSNDAIVSVIIEQPAPRFYITPGHAKEIIHAFKSKDYKRCNLRSKLRQEMAEDLVANFDRLCKQFPHTPKEKIYEMVVEQPAKLFYVTHRVARDIIFNYTGRNGKRK